MLPVWAFVVLWVWAGIIVFKHVKEEGGTLHGWQSLFIFGVIVMLWPLEPLLEMIFDID